MLQLTQRVLIVDPGQSGRLYLKNCLLEMGLVDIVEVEDGGQAWDLLVEGSMGDAPFTLVFSELNLPRVSGLELLRLLRKHPACQKLPVVLVTAESDREWVVLALEAGADDYIVKPVSLSTLHGKLQRLAARRVRIV